jgi:8-oxo-dGTP diphosphatase
VTPIPVLAAVVKRDNRYLVCQRPTHKRHGGLWEFPGGKLEPNETVVDAAHRELREELGVNVVKIHDPGLSVGDPGSAFVIHFPPVVIDGEPQCLEHLALQWLTLRELQDVALAPSDRAFVDFLLSAIDGDEQAKGASR